MRAAAQWLLITAAALMTAACEAGPVNISGRWACDLGDGEALLVDLGSTGDGGTSGLQVEMRPGGPALTVKQ